MMVSRLGSYDSQRAARAVDVRLQTARDHCRRNVFDFPVVLIDLATEEGIQGAVYIFAYDRFAMKPLRSCWSKHSAN